MAGLSTPQVSNSFLSKAQQQAGLATNTYMGQTPKQEQTITAPGKTVGGALSAGAGGAATGSAIGSMAAGASTGSSAGWWGAAIGAGVGLLSYYLS